MSSKILFFNPYSGIMEHLKIEKDLARIVRNSKIEIDFLRCNGLYNNFCSVMSAMGLNSNSSEKVRHDICKKCRSLDLFSRDSKKSQYQFIDDLLSDDIRVQVSRMMLDISIENWMDYEFRDVQFGRIAAYEFLLSNKISTPQIPPKLWGELRLEIESTLTTYLIAYDFLKHSEYQLVGVYNFLYGMNRAFTIAAEHLEIETFSIQANGYIHDTHARYLIYDTTNSFWHLNASTEWDVAKNNPLTLFQILQVYKHFKALFDAKSVWTYSSPKSSLDKAAIRRKLGIPENKNITLLTTSSADELFAIRFVGLISQDLSISTGVFESNLDWISKTIDIYKSNLEEYLVIRIHPREFANKREGVDSKEGSAILNFLRRMQLPKNIIVNEPADKISLYDLAGITELLINSTSTVGLEFAVLGIPSISVSPKILSAYPIEISEALDSQDAYKQLISLSKNSKDFFKVKLAFRWMNFRYTNCTVAIPRRYIFLDRVYFGPFMRFVDRYPKFNSICIFTIDIVYLIFESLDRRKFSKKSTLSAKSRRNVVENFSIRIVTKLINSSN